MIGRLKEAEREREAEVEDAEGFGGSVKKVRGSVVRLAKEEDEVVETASSGQKRKAAGAAEEEDDPSLSAGLPHPHTGIGWRSKPEGWVAAGTTCLVGVGAEGSLGVGGTDADFTLWMKREVPVTVDEAEGGPPARSLSGCFSPHCDMTCVCSQKDGTWSYSLHMIKTPSQVPLNGTLSGCFACSAGVVVPMCPGLALLAPQLHPDFSLAPPNEPRCLGCGCPSVDGCKACQSECSHDTVAVVVNIPEEEEVAAAVVPGEGVFSWSALASSRVMVALTESRVLRGWTWSAGQVTADAPASPRLGALTDVSIEQSEDGCFSDARIIQLIPPAGAGTVAGVLAATVEPPTLQHTGLSVATTDDDGVVTAFSVADPVTVVDLDAPVVHLHHLSPTSVLFTDAAGRLGQIFCSQGFGNGSRETGTVTFAPAALVGASAPAVSPDGVIAAVGDRSGDLYLFQLAQSPNDPIVVTECLGTRHSRLPLTHVVVAGSSPAYNILAGGESPFLYKWEWRTVEEQERREHLWAEYNETKEVLEEMLVSGKPQEDVEVAEVEVTDVEVAVKPSGKIEEEEEEM